MVHHIRVNRILKYFEITSLDTRTINLSKNMMQRNGMAYGGIAFWRAFNSKFWYRVHRYKYVYVISRTIV